MHNNNLNKFYGVYCYDISFGSSPTVYLLGFYKNILEAADRLNNYIPDYKQHINNTVTNSRRVGWINLCTFGDIDHIDKRGKGCRQPDNAINLFEE